MRATEAARGHVTFTVRADARHLNPLGGVHGGFAATVLDSVTGCAVHTMLDVGVGYGTVDLNVKMLKAIPLDRDLTAEGRVIHLSRSIGVSEGIHQRRRGNAVRPRHRDLRHPAAPDPGARSAGGQPLGRGHRRGSDTLADMARALVPHSSHWGAFEAEVADGTVVAIHPYRHDPDPSPLLGNIVDSLRHRARIAQPMIRAGWLDRGPGPRRASRRRAVRARQLDDGDRPARARARGGSTTGTGARASTAARTAGAAPAASTTRRASSTASSIASAATCAASTPTATARSR